MASSRNSRPAACAGIISRHRRRTCTDRGIPTGMSSDTHKQTSLHACGRTHTHAHTHTLLKARRQIDRRNLDFSLPWQPMRSVARRGDFDLDKLTLWDVLVTMCVSVPAFLVSICKRRFSFVIDFAFPLSRTQQSAVPNASVAAAAVQPALFAPAPAVAAPRCERLLTFSKFSYRRWEG